MGVMKPLGKRFHKQTMGDDDDDDVYDVYDDDDDDDDDDDYDDDVFVITFSADGSFKGKASSCKEHLGHAMLNVRVAQWSPMSFAPFNVDALPVPNGTGWIYHFGWQNDRSGSPTVANPSNLDNLIIPE